MLLKPFQTMLQTMIRSSLPCLAGAMLLAAGVPIQAAAPAGSTGGTVSYELRQQLSAPVSAWIGKQTEAKNADGVPFKRGTFSRGFERVDDNTYHVTAHIDTAAEFTAQTERFLLTLKKDPVKGWEVAGSELKDTYSVLHRSERTECYPYKSFALAKEGLTISASDGTMCESFLTGKVFGFTVFGSAMRQAYEPPAHASAIPTGHDVYAVSKMLQEDHSRELVFDPVLFQIFCDPETCEKLIAEGFTQLERAPQTGGASTGTSTGRGRPVPEWMQKRFDLLAKQRRENAFAHFRRPAWEGNRYYTIYVARDWEPPFYAKLFNDEGGYLPFPGVYLFYNNWGGWEVRFEVYPPRIDLPDAMVGTIYGYHTEETVKNTSPYDLEARTDEESRWYDLHSVNGTVEVALEDAERFSGDLEFGITIRQDTRELPFQIASNRAESLTGKPKPRIMTVNSIQMDGKELTWVKTGAISGLVILPEVAKAGSKIKVRMGFTTRALYKVNHAYSAMNRGGWLPFVRFGDFIDEFEMTIKAPSDYQIIGIGRKIKEQKVGNVLVSQWKSDSPVEFPTIIIGKYNSAKPSIVAKKLDGTVIPVEVHVDEVSMGILAVDATSFETQQESVEALNSGARGIRPSQLIPIGDQAVNALNLYAQITGVDYPYGELNLINDPQGFLYGQAPSSLIYLGFGVFRGEGTMAGETFLGGGSTDISKFLKDVVAHEVGHQWWGSRVANTNDRNYWFVETMAEFFSALFVENVYSPKKYQEKINEWRSNILRADLKTGVQNVYSLWPGESGGSAQAAIYNKGPYAFHMLRETVGDAKFFPALKTMTQELTKKKEIVTFDIQNTLENALGGVDKDGNPYKMDLGWFFDQWIRSPGIPEFKFDYTTRQSEDGSWLIEGTITQRVVVGSSASHEILEGRNYRGFVEITVMTKDQNFEKRLVVEKAQTPFKLKVPKKPIEVVLNKDGGILALDPVVNKSW